ncbi:HU family DNA-binding protein [Streptomyces cucumeris]|uniref:HU family DNA-binding protein n=1 Tax=Streptomyces cucumeris TaxID=2962890 RepID=UPI003D6F452C
MNKAQLIKVVATATGDHAQATLAVETAFDAIVRAVVAGDRFSYTGFGSLTREDRPARDTRNPLTGEPMHLGKRRVVKFRPGTRFKEFVAGRRGVPESGNCIQKDPQTPKTARP